MNINRRARLQGGFTLVELIAVMAIVSVLMIFTVPHMASYIQGTRRAAAMVEAREAADAVQRYLDDEKEKGDLEPKELRKLMETNLNDPNGVLKDYISGGQKDARIASIEVDVKSGTLKKLVYDNEAVRIRIDIEEDGTRTIEDVTGR